MKTYTLEKTPTHTFLYEKTSTDQKTACVGVFKNSSSLSKKLEDAKKRLQTHGMAFND